MTRIAFSLFLLALLAAAQEPAAPAGASFLRIHDLGPLSPVSGRPEDRTPLAEGGFGLLGPENVASGDEPAWMRLPEEQPESRRDLVLEIFRSFAVGVEMECWDVAQGSGILVRTTEEGHRMIARILDLLRRPGTPPVEMEVSHFSIDARTLDEAAAAALRAAAEGRLDADQLAVLARCDTSKGRDRGTLHGSLGRWSCFRAAREVRYLPDYDVEIAQASAIADPIPRIATEGFVAAIRPLPMQDGRLLLRIVASAGRIDGGIRSFDLAAREQLDSLRIRNTDFGLIEQCDFQGGAVATDAAVSAGRPCAAVLASPAPGGTRYEVIAVTVRTLPKPPAPDTFLVAPIGALVAADPEWLFAWHAESGELQLLPIAGGEGRPPLDGGALLDALDLASIHPDGSGFLYRDETLYGGSLLLRADEAGARAALERLKEVERALVRPVWLDIRFAVEAPGAVAREVGVLASPLNVGRRMAAAAYRRMDSVGDYDVEVAQEARIADPIPHTVTAGLFANALVVPGSEQALRLLLDLEVAGVPEAIRTILPAAGGVPALQSESVRRREERLRIDLVPGQPKSIHLGSDPFDPAGEGRLIVTLGLHLR
jgi:hypothetical protein